MLDITITNPTMIGAGRRLDKEVRPAASTGSPADSGRNPAGVAMGLALFVPNLVQSLVSDSRVGYCRAQGTQLRLRILEKRDATLRAFSMS
jgi:hypothetical protein